MKKVSLLVAALLAALGSVPAQAAGTASNTFNVDITLTPACQITTVPVIAFTYASFQISPATASSTFGVQCTGGLMVSSVTLDQAAVTDQYTQLAYTLTLGTATNPLPSPLIGTGLVQTIGISGTMPAGQAGSCGLASCVNTASTNKTRTLTITY